MSPDHIITLQRMLDLRKERRTAQEKWFNEATKYLELHSDDKVYADTQRWFMRNTVQHITTLTPEIEALEAALEAHKRPTVTVSDLSPEQAVRASQAAQMSDAKGL